MWICVLWCMYGGQMVRGQLYEVSEVLGLNLGHGVYTVILYLLSQLVRPIGGVLFCFWVSLSLTCLCLPNMRSVGNENEK